MTTIDLINDLRIRVNPLYSATPGTESYERRLCAEELEKQVELIEQQAVELKHLKALLRAVFEELDEGDGNAPGDSHEKPGIWDDDNTPDIAGKPCHWCELWAMVKEVTK
tara:strand:+ start:650 stop:979 length:330 start_codon:yes stop_codon:yes gene_type:complete